MPLPPNIAEVKQKLQPIGRPTGGDSGSRQRRRGGRRRPVFHVPETRNDLRWRIGRSTASPRKRRNQATPSPLTWSASIRTGQVGDVRDVPADDELRYWRINAHIFATFPWLGMIAVMPSNIIFPLEELGETIPAWGSRAPCKEPQMLAEMSMIPQLRWNIRRRTGAARHLVVIQLHRVQPAAAVLVVHAVRPEDAGQQDLRPLAQRMDGNFHPDLPRLGGGGRFEAVISESVAVSSFRALICSVAAVRRIVALEDILGV